MKNVIKHKLPDTREEWLANRSMGIGGSDAGTVLGLNKYKSAYTLWAEKTGILEAPDIDNEAMRVGRDLEDYVAKRFTEETGKKVRRSGFSYQSIEHPFMLANVDRLIVSEDAGLECKTASAMTKVKYEDGNIPESYYAQCMHYMAVTGLSKWYIAVLVMGKGFYWYEVNRNEEEIKVLIEQEKEFWNLVQTKEEPGIDGSESTTKTIAALYNSECDVESDRDCTAVESELEIIANLDDQIKELKDKKDEYQNKVKKFMEDSAFGHSPNFKISFKAQNGRTSVDSKKLKKDYPEIYEECKKVSAPTRPFKLERV